MSLPDVFRGGSLFVKNGHPDEARLRRQFTTRNPQYDVMVRLRENGRKVPLPEKETIHWQEHLGYTLFPRATEVEVWPIEDRTTKPLAEPLHVRMGYNMRDYQQDALDEWVRSGMNGFVHGVCGSGKTTIGVAAMELVQTRALVLVHTLDLAKQWISRVEDILRDSKELAVRPGLIGGGKLEVDARIVVATFQSLSRWDFEKLYRFGREFGLVIGDECFVAGTRITMADGSLRRIESIAPGEKVMSFDETTASFQPRRVVRLFKSTPHEMVRVTVDGAVIVCTESHPFLTTKGWVVAADLTTRSMVLKQPNEDRVRVVRRPDEQDPQQQTAMSVRPVCSEVQEGVCATERSEAQEHTACAAVHMVRHRGEDRHASTDGGSPSRPCTLQRGAQECVSVKTQFRDDGFDKQEVCAKENDRKQPNETGEDTDEVVGNAAPHRSQAEDSRRKRQASHESAGGPGYGARMADGGCCPDGTIQSGAAPAQFLQDRHCKRGCDGGNRSRRIVPQLAESQGQGRQEDDVLEFARVESVEVLEPSGDGRFADLCPDGHVYNLEVEGTHTYIAGGVVVHNCHHVPSATFGAVMGALPARHRLALTATPERTDRLEWLIEAHVGPKVATIDQQMLLAAGVSVVPSVTKRRTGMAYTGDDWVALVDRITKDEMRNDMIVSEVDLLTRMGHQCIVITDRIEHAETLAGFVEAPATVLTSKVPARARDDILERLRQGEFRSVFATSLADEGLDIPGLSALVLATPNKNMPRLEQRLGRIMRPSSEKLAPMVVDFVDVGDRFEWMWKKRVSRYKRIGCEVQQ